MNPAHNQNPSPISPATTAILSHILILQTQANLISIPVYRPKMRETTALGAAIAAGLAVGLWRNFAELRDINRAGGAVFEPEITREESSSMFSEWEKAVQMSRGWIGNGSRDSHNDSAPSNPLPLPPSQDPSSKTNGAPLLSRQNSRRSLHPKSGTNTPTAAATATEQHPGSLVADMVMNSGGNVPAVKVTTVTANGDIEFPPAKTPLISISGDLDDADEEDLFLELRKVEILQKLKKVRKLKLSYY